MVFASLTFMFAVLPLFLAFDFGARIFRSVSMRNTALLAASLLFYVWGEAANVFLLLALGIINYFAGNFLPRCRSPRFWLVVCVGINLGVLFFFKYAYWLISLVMPSLTVQKTAMPLGISFFTFHAVSYIVDVYRRQIEPAENPLDFLTYFCMFPHLVAGPIVRYAQVQDDLKERGPSRELFAFGVYRFLVGLNKKVIIANSVSILADSAFSMSRLGALSFADAWIGVMAYAIQIYFDFSGYSDMAIGLAAMAGFRFEENFRRPYSSTNIREFWRRWHISLSSWLRDYLYIPLGGNRRGRFATYRNLLIVFVLCGLWHGADVTFILWGLWHGLFLVAERLPLGRALEKLPLVPARCYTLFVVLVGWVFFRAENMDSAGAYIRSMFAFSLEPVALTYHTTGFIALLVGVLLCLVPDRFFPAPTSRSPEAFSGAAYGVQAVSAVLSIAFLLTSARNPFIYFNF